MRWPWSKKSKDPRTGRAGLGFSGCGRCKTGWDVLLRAGIEPCSGTIWFCEHSDSDPCTGLSSLCALCYDELGSNAARLPYWVATLVWHASKGWLTPPEFRARLDALLRAADRPEGWTPHMAAHPGSAMRYAALGRWAEAAAGRIPENHKP